MDANINHQHGHMYRIENVDIQELVNLLTGVFAYSNSVNLIIDTKMNAIYVEAPPNVTDEDEQHIADSINVITPLNEVVVSNEMLELLKSR